VLAKVALHNGHFWCWWRPTDMLLVSLFGDATDGQRSDKTVCLAYHGFIWFAGTHTSCTSPCNKTGKRSSSRLVFGSAMKVLVGRRLCFGDPRARQHRPGYIRLALSHRADNCQLASARRSARCAKRNRSHCWEAFYLVRDGAGTCSGRVTSGRCHPVRRQPEGRVDAVPR